MDLRVSVFRMFLTSGLTMRAASEVEGWDLRLETCKRSKTKALKSKPIPKTKATNSERRVRRMALSHAWLV